MKKNPRWLKATIEFTKTSDNKMPWALSGNRRDWAKRCSERAKTND